MPPPHLLTTERLRKGYVIVRTVARREDCESDYGKVPRTLRDFLSVDLRDAIGRIPEGTTPECAENHVADTVRSQRVKLRRDPPPGVMRIEVGPVTKVLGSRTKL